jgi:hypothetical protein
MTFKCYAFSQGIGFTVVLWHLNQSIMYPNCPSVWPRNLRCGCVATRLLRLWVRIPPGAWMSVSCVCCVLSGRSLCVGLITRPEESYQVWCVWVWFQNLSNEEDYAHCCCSVINKVSQLNKQICLHLTLNSQIVPTSFLQAVQLLSVWSNPEMYLRYFHL